MKVVELSQREDREAWLELKRGKIGGTRAKPIKPLSRGPDPIPAAFWDLVAEHLTKESDYSDESPIARGNRLEQTAISKASEILGLPFNDNAGIWISDLDPDISVSPDAAEPVDSPTYSMEAKALGAGKHFKYLYKAKKCVNDPECNPIDTVPNEKGAFFKEQSVQYFVVNELLQDHYFVLYNEDCIYEQHEIVIIHIRRSDVEKLIEEQTNVEIRMMAMAREVISELREGL